ncbi:hypothetical protein BKA64DRAFT_662210 [Cadophora sp. MPI-SDFR-AT-0126]|nr:hypothetical protein BKA64DRAFT_662210 [Leotiomycetes sp. MPI-SDFR-AT-0126]
MPPVGRVCFLSTAKVLFQTLITAEFTYSSSCGCEFSLAAKIGIGICRGTELRRPEHSTNAKNGAYPETQMFTVCDGTTPTSQ